jgi:N-acetylmuramoyl-L-alanine amidase
MNMRAIIVALAIIVAQPAFAECDYNKQLKALALNIYHEARGEGKEGMQMVGEVVLNRVDHSKYPDTICDVVYQSGQFSWVKQMKNHAPKEEEMWSLSMRMAERLLNGDITLYDNGATHFLNPKVVRKMPLWAIKFDKVATVGNHVFYEQPNG